MNIQSFARRNPAVFGILAISVVMFLVSFAAPQTIAPFLRFPGADWMRAPWTLFTYILAWPMGSIVGLLFMILALYSFGSSLETRFGTPWFLKLFGIATLSGSVIAIFASFIEPNATIVTPWVPTSLVMIAWCGFNRLESIMMYGLVRIPAPILALITGAILTFGTLSLGPIGSVSLLVPAALFWLYSIGQLPGVSRARPTVSTGVKADAAAKRKAQAEREYLDRVQDRVKEREERERLRKLFEASLKDDPDQKKG